MSLVIIIHVIPAWESLLAYSQFFKETHIDDKEYHEYSHHYNNVFVHFIIN
jgi:hypothetical protein